MLSSENSAENWSLSRFQPWLWRITVPNRKIFFKSNFFYILSWTILRLSKKEIPDLSKNWSQEKLSKLTSRKSVLKTGFWAAKIQKIFDLKKNFLLGAVIRQSQGWKRPKNRFSALFSENMHFRNFFFNNICFKYPYANPLSVPKDSEKFILNQTT